jgi:hypothetical protein
LWFIKDKVIKFHWKETFFFFFVKKQSLFFWVTNQTQEN